MEKLDPELSRPSERFTNIQGEELLAFLEKEKRNTIICCNNLHSLNLLASSLKKSLVKENLNAVFYGNNEVEKFIADSLVNNYGEAFSELVGDDGVHNEVNRNAKTILILKNGEKLDDNEISILRSLSERADPEKNKVIIFFNIGISVEKVKKKIDKFGNLFSLYDAQHIKIQEDKADTSLSPIREVKKPVDEAVDDFPTDKKELGVSTRISKYKSKKIKIIFVLLLVVGFLLSLEEKMQTKILHIINTSSSGKISLSRSSDNSKQDFYSLAQTKLAAIYLSGYRSNIDGYASR